MALGGMLLGVVLDLIGILFSTSGNLLIRWIANRDERKLLADPNYQKPKEYVDPLWYLIVILLFGNGAIDFAAFQFATMTILAPLASVSIVLNSVVAYFLLGEKFTILHGIGSLIMICGATLTVITGPVESERQVTVYIVWDFFLREDYLAFLLGKGLLLACCIVYINVVPVVELEKHPRQPAKIEKPAHTEPLINFSNDIAPAPSRVSSNVVTILDEADSMSGAEPSSQLRKDSRGDLLTASSQATSFARKASGLNSTEKARSRQNSVLQEYQGEPVPRPCWQRLFYTQGHVIIWAFLVSGVGSYTNLFGKMFVKLIAASGEGNMQFTHWGAYVLAVLLVAAAITQLHLMKICLARFESIVIMPSLNCMYILHLMCEGGMFFNEFQQFTSDLDKGLFALSIVIAFIGIAVASSVKEQSPPAVAEQSKPLLCEEPSL